MKPSIILLTIGLIIYSKWTEAQLTEPQMIARLDEYNQAAIELCTRGSLAGWDVQTNVGDAEKVAYQQEVSIENARLRLQFWEETWRDAVIEDYQNPDVQRQLTFLKQLGTAALTEEQLTELSSSVSRMSTIYNSAVICPYENQNCDLNDPDADVLTLDPEIEGRLAQSTDYDELEYLWKEWRDQSGRKMRDDYRTYVELMDVTAKANNFLDASLYWQSGYEDDQFIEKIDRLWDELTPLYDSLHTYVRYKLIELYGDKFDQTNPNIPAHLLGNMWAQSWNNLYDRIKPFQNASLVDVTGTMIELGYDATSMFDVADEFYTSLELFSNDMSYGELAMITKPENRTVNCHASAWDFCDGVDYRIKMCTNINMEDFITIHHEMGHIQYFQQYKTVPLAMRGGANPGFHEAVGDTIALAVATPQHLIKVGLLSNYADSEEDNINALFAMALERVAFLPFGLLVDKWRWDVFSGAVPESEWNAHWWTLRERYQKVSAPVSRNETDFDPGAKYHVAANSQYIAYFVAHLLEFQMYRSLCTAAGEFDPANPLEKSLHKCDFYQSAAAGQRLSDGLRLGRSVHWSVALEAMTGENDLSAGALLDYFQPLKDFLDRQNRQSQLRSTLETYNIEATAQCTRYVTAEWNVDTDVNSDAKKAILQQVIKDQAQFDMEQFRLHFEGLRPEDYDDPFVSRQIMFLSKLGISILSDDQLDNLTEANSRMQGIYNNAKVCPFDNQNCDLDTEGYTLDPEITEVLATSTNFDEQLYMWQQWHESTGRLMRTDYKIYLDISNEAARLNEYADNGEMWRADYEDPDLERNSRTIWQQVEPLYNELHTYVRHKLIELYPDHIDQEDPLIPAHLLGNMWAQSWVNLYERIKPFPDASDIDVSSSMVANGFTPLSMFQESDRFYQSLGLPSNEMSYTGESIIVKPTDRTIVCHASAWDFCDGEDFRVKQCTVVNMEDFVTAHHEMGHIQYYIQYKDQPLPFRSGANPGFHEAVGDLIALSVSTPSHLEKIGLLTDFADSEEDNINALFKMALERVAFLPFGLLIDLYRWDLFSGNVPDTQWNQHWEDLRELYQKIRSPVPRSEEDFDAGAKFHVASGYQYMNYFVAHILEFQLHKALCIVADQYTPGSEDQPLHKCDIEGSLPAGERLHAGLSLGVSRHWSDALEAMTGERELKADALIEYFAPLYEYLQRENELWTPPEVADNLVGIIVGSVIGGLLILALIGYGIYYFSKQKRLKAKVEPLP